MNIPELDTLLLGTTSMVLQNNCWVAGWCSDRGAMFERGRTKYGTRNKKRRIESEDTEENKEGIGSEFERTHTERMSEFQTSGEFPFTQP